jgi:hypothetical protein
VGRAIVLQADFVCHRSGDVGMGEQGRLWLKDGFERRSVGEVNVTHTIESHSADVFPMEHGSSVILARTVDKAQVIDNVTEVDRSKVEMRSPPHRSSPTISSHCQDRTTKEVG